MNEYFICLYLIKKKRLIIGILGNLYRNFGGMMWSEKIKEDSMRLIILLLLLLTACSHMEEPVPDRAQERPDNTEPIAENEEYQPNKTGHVKKLSNEGETFQSLLQDHYVILDTGKGKKMTDLKGTDLFSVSEGISSIIHADSSGWLGTDFFVNPTSPAIIQFADGEEEKYPIGISFSEPLDILFFNGSIYMAGYDQDFKFLLVKWDIRPQLFEVKQSAMEFTDISAEELDTERIHFFTHQNTLYLQINYQKALKLVDGSWQVTNLLNSDIPLVYSDTGHKKYTSILEDSCTAQVSISKDGTIQINDKAFPAFFDPAFSSFTLDDCNGEHVLFTVRSANYKKHYVWNGKDVVPLNKTHIMAKLIDDHFAVFMQNNRIEIYNLKEQKGIDSIHIDFEMIEFYINQNILLLVDNKGQIYRVNLQKYDFAKGEMKNN